MLHDSDSDLNNLSDLNTNVEKATTTPKIVIDQTKIYNSINNNERLLPDFTESLEINKKKNDVNALLEKKSKQRGGHPNIHHHPPIHPHNHYQRLNSPGPRMTVDTSALSCSNPVESLNTNPVHSLNSSFNTNQIDILSTLNPESNELTNDIKQIQELIDKLNFEIFKNPRNCTRPPSEYLEIYNTFTEQLHNLQIRKQTIDSQNDNKKALESKKKLFESRASVNNEFVQNTIPKSSPNGLEIHKNTSNEFNQDGVLKPVSKSLELTLTNSLNSPKFNTRSENFDSRKPPLPKTSIVSSLPKLKLDHPLNLNTQPQSTKHANVSSAITSPSLSHTSSRKNSTQFYISNSLQGSPATTPNCSNGDNESSSIIKLFTNERNKIDSSLNSPHDGSPFNSTLSSPYSTQINSQQPNSTLIMSHNSRSFGDINDAIGLNTNSNNLQLVSSISPSPSMATTPTFYGSNSLSSFLRIFIGSSTAVVEKKAIPLKEALVSKLKSRNLEIDKCIVYIKDNNKKIEWDMEVSKIVADNIVVAELSDEIQHSFEKKTFTFRSCEWCKKRFVLNAYACTKCDHIMCQRNECRSKSECIVCVPRRLQNNIPLTNTASVIIAKPELEFGRPESPNIENSINISQQILPVNQLKVSIPSRDRSRSETELNIFANTKLNENTSQNSSSPLNRKKTMKNYGILQQKFPLKQSQTEQESSLVNDDVAAFNQISGSINEESGSVINSLCTNKSPEISSPEEGIVQLRNDPIKSSKSHVIDKLHKPSRRDSFNAWEIPFKQIKIDMNRKVGSGSFGIVHQGKDFYHGIVAIKFLNVQNPTPHQSYAFRNEVAILKSTRHDNVLLFIGCILKPYLAIVTEWCPGSSLYKHIHVEEEYWEMNQLVDIAKQTATGMEYLHARDILHRDLKSNNIFLIPKETYNFRSINSYQNQFQNGNKKTNFMNKEEINYDKWTVKIGDFGLATVKSTWTQTSAKTNQPTGSILWMAPEVITQKISDPYTHKSDVYSFAVVLFELVTGHLPYLQKEQNMILFLVGSGRLKLNSDEARNDTPGGIKDLIKLCSEYDRNKRLEFVEINERLKEIRPIRLKSRIQRAQSVPNLGHSNENDQFYVSNFGMYEDEIYPRTPDLSKLRNRDSSNFSLINSNSNLSELITNIF